MGKVRHIVIFVAKPGVDASEILSLLHNLSKGPGVLSFAAEQSLDTRKGTVVIENVLFADERSFEAFKLSPAHKRVGEKMSQLADWLVADYIEPERSAQ